MILEKGPATQTCPKCGQVYEPLGADYGEDPWLDPAHQDDCPYARCDDGDCRALRAPTTIDELCAALAHWQGHRNYGGCSHGC